MYCFNCGNKLGKGHFCSKCGFENKTENKEIKKEKNEIREEIKDERNNKEYSLVVFRIIGAIISSYTSSYIGLAVFVLSIFSFSYSREILPLILSLIFWSNVVILLLLFYSIYLAFKPTRKGLDICGIIYIIFSILSINLFGLATGIIHLKSKEIE